VSAGDLPPWPEPFAYTLSEEHLWVSEHPASTELLFMYERQRAEAAIARLRYLYDAIKRHNDACAESCGIGDQEGVACKYRPYFPRHCPSCMLDEQIVDVYGTRLELVVGPVPE
jgi:hypothetical protein